MTGELTYNEPMSEHTTFKTGGPADVFCAPADIGELKNILAAASDCRAGVFILGGGANLLVSDKGIRGIVVDIRHFDSARISPDGLGTFGAGITMDRAAEYALEAGFAGLDSFYGMPGTVGGAVWMNARCYGRSISDILVSVKYLDRPAATQPVGCEVRTLEAAAADFEYKVSPFQSMDSVILEAAFRLEPAGRDSIRESMNANRSDRENKGHYAGPSAGSVFKNNRSFGRPSGAIIDSLKLRGATVGGAKISDNHANIFINTGSATSADILELIRLAQSRVKNAYGFELEPEVQLIGEFDE